jgi:hypothetical protein
MDRIMKLFHPSNEQNDQPSIIDVSLVTVAPILFVLAGGYVIGTFVLVIEQCANGKFMKYWSRGRVGAK